MIDEENRLPFVSIIMPIRNEAHFIAHSLGALFRQDYPHARMEILIADGMSTDATRSIVTQVSIQYPNIHLELIDNSQKIVPAGFNRALAKARGEIIIRVDGHTVIAPDYVRQCVNVLQRSEADNVGGRMKAVGGDQLTQAIALATSSPFGLGGARFHYSTREEWVDTVYMGAWPRAVFDRIGCFDEEFVRNQDDEFNYRLRSQGGRILLSPAIQSEYYPRSTLRTLWRQYYQYGYYKVRVMQKHLGQMRPRQFAPPLFAAGVLGGAVAIWHPLLFGLWLAAMILYGIANLTASFLTARRHGWQHLRWLPIVYLILHLSYGLGFLRSLVKYRKRWGK